MGSTVPREAALGMGSPLLHASSMSPVASPQGSLLVGRVAMDTDVRPSSWASPLCAGPVPAPRPAARAGAASAVAGRDGVVGRGAGQQSLPCRHASRSPGGRPSVWSVIVPLSWVKPFWLFLVSHGAHAIGLRERRWIASKFKMPCFPYDYPDSKAYSLFMTEEAAISDKAAEYRPAAKRPPRVPVPPLWHCIMASLHEEDSIVRHLEVDDLKPSAMVLTECCPVNSNCGDSGSSPTAIASTQLLVPRTIQTLRQYVKELDMKSLSSSSEMEIGTDQPNLFFGGTVKTASSVNGLCLVRVLIRAFKEGSFEEGAVVCAPLLSDLAAWKTRSKEEDEECIEKWEVQLPQSHISSYFSSLVPGTCDLEYPKDDMAREAWRWPIGFVTTGFVHGSTGKDAAAVAFCEARLLAVLRRQQWTHESMQGREICVLVRNARSVAYRRALATVVLEQQKEDLEFM